MEEKWKTIKEYEGLYEVSNLGRVRSLKRATTSGKILKPHPNRCGYLQVTLCKDNIKKTRRIHRLVASAFVDNNDPINNVINHKNEDKRDNRAENLEWCTVKYNTNYNGMNYRRMASRRVPIIAKKNCEVLRFESVTKAAEILGVSHTNISSCLHGRHGHKTIKGYRFEYDNAPKD